MIIYGWGRKTVKKFGGGRTYQCPNCRNVTPFELASVRKWFTLFWIPVIPYETKYLEYCPVCSRGGELPKEEFQARLQEAQANRNYITGGANPVPPSTAPLAPPPTSGTDPLLPPNS